MYNSAAGDSEAATEKTSLHVETPPEVSEERDPDPDPVEPKSEERESVLSENTKKLKERHEVQENHPHVDSQTDHPHGEQSSFKPFEEILKDKLKVPESENNQTSNSSQVSKEQETIDAYTFLKKEMTLDLKTKLGSTADAIVSDDETTRLVTSLEDDFDEDLDVEYYVVGREEEEDSEENFDELPLLTFTAGEDWKTPLKSGVEKYLTDKEQNSSEEDKVEVTQSSGLKNDDKNTVTSWEDTIFSAVPEGEEQTGMDLESSNSEEEVEDGDSKWRKPQLATDYTDPKKTEDGLLSVEVPKTNNDKDPQMDTELHIKGKGRTVEESKKDPVQDKKGLEDEKQETRTLHGSPQSRNPDSLPTAEKSKETLKSAFDHKENDLKGAAVHISKGVLHEDTPGEQSLEGGSESGSEHKAARYEMKEEKIKGDAMGVAPLLEDSQQNASKDRLVSGVKPHTLSVEQRSEEFKEEPLLKTQNQPRFSSPDEIGLSRELEEEGPILGRNLSWQQERDVAAAVKKQVNEKPRLSEEEVTGDPLGGDTLDEKYVHPKPGTQEARTTGHTDSAEVPDFHTEKPEAEDDEQFIREEQLEDENAVSAKQSKEESPEMQHRQLDGNRQGPQIGILGAVSTDAETEENKEETSNILEIERKSTTVGEGVDPLGREPRGLVVEKEESPLVDKKAQSPPEGMFVPDKKNDQTPEVEEAFQNKDSDDLKDSPEEQLKTSPLAEEPGAGERSQEDEEDLERVMDTESQGAASQGRADGLPPGTPHTTAEPEHGGHGEDVPIISSFFKEQQSLQRFQKYFNIHELEAMFQEMSLKLKSAQRESLPYNVEKVLDKVFRTFELQILSVAEKMLDTRVTENRDVGMKENIHEEAAVLDDVQDLIYFVRYRHSAGEETVPLAVARPPEEGWSGPAEGKVPSCGLVESGWRGRWGVGGLLKRLIPYL